MCLHPAREEVSLIAGSMADGHLDPQRSAPCLCIIYSMASVCIASVAKLCIRTYYDVTWAI